MCSVPATPGWPARWVRTALAETRPGPRTAQAVPGCRSPSLPRHSPCSLQRAPQCGEAGQRAHAAGWSHARKQFKPNNKAATLGNIRSPQRPKLPFLEENRRELVAGERAQCHLDVVAASATSLCHLPEHRPGAGRSCKCSPPADASTPQSSYGDKQQALQLTDVATKARRACVPCLRSQSKYAVQSDPIRVRDPKGQTASHGRIHPYSQRPPLSQTVISGVIVQ